jgi:hypothetical protein
MKKAALLILVLFAIVSFASCTDLTEEDETDFELYQVDRRKIERPGSQGGG